MKSATRFMPRSVKRTGLALACLGGLLSAAPAALAQSGGYDTQFTLGAGLACEFPVTIEARGTSNFYREFKDQNGEVIRIMSAGSNVDYRFTNEWTHFQYVVQGRGAMTRNAPTGDGGWAYTMQGHSWLFLFPSDIPAGPKGTQYEGRVSFTVDANGITTVQETSGRQTDFCALLSASVG